MPNVEGDLTASTSAERAPRTLFVTNDFPPRIGGAQSYYWGVIRTLDPSEVAILAPAHIDAAAFDATHPYTVVRASTSVLWPTNAMLHTVEQMAEREGAELIQLGHPLPAGLLGPRLRQRRGLPYVVFLGGAEVTLPGVVPGVNNMLRHVLGNASMLLTVSEYTAAAARKQTGGKVPAEVLRPPLLVDEFAPAADDEAACLRERLGIDGQIVVCVGRLVPRKGQDKLIDALALLRSEFPRLHLVLIGEGRLATGLYDRAQKRGVGE
ncbi:MAG TPA: glycosyltransferase family 4 protein, partial [Thermoleophilia bacterium]